MAYSCRPEIFKPGRNAHSNSTLLIKIDLNQALLVGITVILALDENEFQLGQKKTRYPAF